MATKDLDLTQASAADRLLRFRQLVNNVVVVSMALTTAFVVFVLAVIVIYILIQGIGYINWSFLTEMPVPLGQPGGGIFNSIVGSLIIVGLAALISIPIGVGAAIYLSEFPGFWLHKAVRFVADILTGVPSIVVGLFAYTLLVATTKSFSGIAGAVALAFIMVPIVVITSQEALRLVPMSFREAALALGIPRWRTILLVAIPVARRALVTGLVLALARALGETAPHIFTSFGNRFFTTDPTRPMSTIPLTIYRYAIGPYDEWHQQAWAAAFILLVVVFLVSFLTRLMFRGRYDV